MQFHNNSFTTSNLQLILLWMFPSYHLVLFKPVYWSTIKLLNCDPDLYTLTRSGD